MRIGIDFDNTIICYDDVFCQIAKNWQWIPLDWQGSKQQIRDIIQARKEGDIGWQRLQGKVYGEFISQAKMFAGFKEFIITCNLNPNVEIFIVSHKTEYGHFDEKRIPLRDVSRQWLCEQGLFEKGSARIQEAHVFFETTREEKIQRIRSLQCTHFIDDLPQVLTHPLFPREIKRFLFQPDPQSEIANEKIVNDNTLHIISSWPAIQQAIFS